MLEVLELRVKVASLEKVRRGKNRQRANMAPFAAPPFHLRITYPSGPFSQSLGQADGLPSSNMGQRDYWDGHLGWDLAESKRLPAKLEGRKTRLVR